MYKLLIVDDEAAIRQGIANSNPWGSWGFQVIGQCSNGLEALDFIEKDIPHVVLSDIRMPKMDGVELMKVLNAKYPQVKIIILSGYSDFEYLNMSIKNNVAEYLLKPTDIEEFEATFRNMKARLDAEKAEKTRIEHIEQEYEKNQEYRHARLLDLMIKGYVDEEGIDRQKAEIESQYRFNFDNCVVTLISPDSRGGDEGRELYKLKISVLEVCNSLDKEFDGIFFLSREETVVGLLGLPPEASLEQEDIRLFFQKLQSAVHERCGATVSVGISELCSEFDMLPQCHAQATCCAKQNIFLGKQSIFFYSQFIEEFSYSRICFSMEALQSALLSGDFHELQKEIDRVFSEFTNKSLKDYDYVDRICTEAMFNISRWALQYNVHFQRVLNSLGAAYSDIYRCDSLHKKSSFMTAVFFALSREIQKTMETSQKYHSVAYLVKKCVDEEYASNSISLDYVAEKLGKNPTYISKVFKNELGYNFSEYLQRKRLNKSSELLVETNMKVYEIADAVGYVDSSNFIKVFRKNFGMSPQDYRLNRSLAGSSEDA